MRWLNAKIHFTHHICLGGRKGGRRGKNKLVGGGFKPLTSELDVPSFLLPDPSLPGRYPGVETPQLHFQVRRPFTRPSLAPGSFVPIFLVSQHCFTEATFLCLSWIWSAAFLGSYSPPLPPFAPFISVPDPSPADVIL